MRVARKKKPALVYEGELIAPNVTVAQAGLSALDRFDVIEERG
jgi:hypothetical protein